MGRMRKRRAAWGLTILEILIAIALLMMVIMATAMVYPGGYKLNETNRLANQATEIARGIVEELMMRPFTTPGGATAGIDSISLQTVSNWTPNFYIAYNCKWPYYDGSAALVDWQKQSPVVSWWGATTAGGTDGMKAYLEDTSHGFGKKVFFLPPNGFEGNVPRGIRIQSYPADFALPLNEPNRQGRLVQIEVTVAWIEARMQAQGAASTLITKFITLNAWRTENKFDF